MAKEKEAGDLGGGQAMPRRLPVVCFGGKRWFFDARLGEYRNVSNPHDRVSIEDAWRRWNHEGAFANAE